MPADDPERNAKQAREALLDHLAVDPRSGARDARVATGRTTTPSEDAAAAYADERPPRHGTRATFDVLMLGVGPGRPRGVAVPRLRAQLDVDDRSPSRSRDSPKPPPDRICLTFAALNRAGEVWFVVSGEDKADAVAMALADGADLHDPRRRAPARQHRSPRWFLGPATLHPWAPGRTPPACRSSRQPWPGSATLRLRR